MGYGTQAGGGERPLQVLFILYGELSSCSGLQVCHFAAALTGRGHLCVIAVPDAPPGGDDGVGEGSGIGAVGYREALRGELPFPGGGPDVIHAWTPRENVRRLAVQLRRRYPESRLAVHLEDNEQVIVEKFLRLPSAAVGLLPAFLLDLLIPSRLTNPRRLRPFLDSADAVTVITEALFEFVPADKPRKVLSPPVDLVAFAPRPADRELRQQLGIKPEETVIVFTGSVHHVNAEEARTLYLAVAEANNEGIPCRLLRTGRNHVRFLSGGERAAARHALELGFVPYGEIPRYLALGDLLVQPGRPGPFNDFRLPSKVPEYLAAGRPVALPATNIGLLLENGVNALLLTRGDVPELVETIRKVREDPPLAARLSREGRAFAEKRFRQEDIGAEVEAFYLGLCGGRCA